MRLFPEHSSLASSGVVDRISQGELINYLNIKNKDEFVPGISKVIFEKGRGVYIHFKDIKYKPKIGESLDLIIESDTFLGLNYRDYFFKSPGNYIFIPQEDLFGDTYISCYGRRCAFIASMIMELKGSRCQKNPKFFNIVNVKSNLEIKGEPPDLILLNTYLSHEKNISINKDNKNCVLNFSSAKVEYSRIFGNSDIILTIEEGSLCTY